MSTTDQLNTALADRYLIERLIGEGGMATVYLARDVKHNRKVALKVLKPDLGAVVGVERFLSEIQVTANLQHPNLLPLFDSGAAGDLLYYVMPFVEGESLRARLEREKQLPIDDAVHIATAVASALDYAHRHGVIHRDLKPENILLHEGEPLVADFGIALALSNAGSGRITQTGISLGTPAYMSPEQATGDRVIDARTDIYSLGAVTYEMLVGEGPHTASTSQAIIARMLTEKPRPVSASRPTVPPHVEAAIGRALEKLPADRWATAKELADALVGTLPMAANTWSGIGGGATGVTVAGLRQQVKTTRVFAIAGWALAALLAIALGIAATRRPPAPVAFRSFIELPESVSVLGTLFAMSRDGSQLVVSGVKEGHHALYLRQADEAQTQLVAGSDSVSGAPSFSPDGRWLLFQAGDHLEKVRTTGGVPQTLADSAGQSAWGDGDVIVYTRKSELWRVNADGTERRLLAAPDTLRRFRLYSYPSVLPGGKAALITIRRGANLIDSARLGIVSLDDGKVTDLGVSGTTSFYAAPGYIVFAQVGGEVVAAPFSLRKLAITGPASVLVQGVVQSATGSTAFAVSENGTLAYRSGPFVTPGAATVAKAMAMFVVDKQGVARQLPFEPQPFGEPRISPDGRHVAVDISTAPGSLGGKRGDVWIYDVTSGTRVRLTTSDSNNFRPEWTRDGTRVVYLTLPPESTFAVSRPWDKSGEPKVLVARGLTSDSDALAELSIGPPHGWSALRVGSANPALRQARILLAPTDSLRATRPFGNPKANENAPSVSPDGRTIAYVSEESGRSEVYIQPLPGPGPQVAVSLDGGIEPIWSPDGSTLFFRGAKRLMTATVIERPALAVGRRDSLFADTYRRGTSSAYYDIFPNGREFLMVGTPVTVQQAGTAQAPPAPSESKVYVIVNWTQLIAKQHGAAGGP